MIQHNGERRFLDNAAIVLPIVIVHSFVYRWLSYHSLVPERILEPTCVDRQIPFLVWTIWPYLGMVGVCIVAPLFVRRPRIFRRLVVSYLIAVCLLLPFYLLLPTVVTRPVYSGPTGSWSAYVYVQVTSRLGAGCCFPSGHIIFPAIGCWMLCRDRRRGARAIAFLTAISSLSILTVKEHVLGDWVGGASVAMVAIAGAEWMQDRIEDRSHRED